MNHQGVWLACWRAIRRVRPVLVGVAFPGFVVGANLCGSAGVLAQPASDGPPPPPATPAVVSGVQIGAENVTVEGRLTIDVPATIWQWQAIDADEPAALVAEDAVAPPPQAQPDVPPPAAASGPKPDVRLVGATDGRDGVVQVLVTDRPLISPEARRWFVDREIQREIGPLRDLGVTDVQVEKPRDLTTDAPASWAARFTGPDGQGYTLRGGIVFGRPTVQVVIVSGSDADAVALTEIVKRITRIGRDGQASPLPSPERLFVAPPGMPGAASTPPPPTAPTATLTDRGLKIDGLVSLGQPSGEGRWTVLPVGPEAPRGGYQWNGPDEAQLILEILPETHTTPESRRQVMVDLVRPRLDIFDELAVTRGQLTAPRPTDTLPTVIETRLSVADDEGTSVVSGAVAVFGKRATYILEAIGSADGDIEALLSVIETLRESPTPDDPTPGRFRRTPNAWPVVAAVGPLSLAGGVTIRPPAGTDGVWRLQPSPISEPPRRVYRYDVPEKPLRLFAIEVAKSFSTPDERRAFALAETTWMKDQLTRSRYGDPQVTVDLSGGDVPTSLPYRQSATLPAGDPPYRAEGRFVFGPATVIVEVSGLAEQVQSVADGILRPLDAR